MIGVSGWTCVGSSCGASFKAVIFNDVVLSDVGAAIWLLAVIVKLVVKNVPGNCRCSAGTNTRDSIAVVTAAAVPSNS